MLNKDDVYMLGEYVRHIKKDSNNVYQYFSIAVLVVVGIAALVFAGYRYIAGALLLVFCFISFFMLFPAQQITKEIIEVEKIYKKLEKSSNTSIK